MPTASTFHRDGWVGQLSASLRVQNMEGLATSSRLTLAVSETVFQFPPLRVNFPLPIRVRISSGVSLGPLANGVYLEKSPNPALTSGLHPGTGGRLGGWQLPEAGPRD